MIGLLLHDSWLSELFSMNPIIQSNNLILALPAKHDLYQAVHYRQWSELLAQSSNTNHVFELSSKTFRLPQLEGPIHAFLMYGLLCSVLLRTSSDINRLVTNSNLIPVKQYNHVPWNICLLDKRASITVPLLTSIVNVYENTLRESNPNCIVIWHCICMLIAVDIDVLARAAGRDGPVSMIAARQELTSWTQTAAARRACIHAAQTFRVLSHRKPADGTAFQSVRTLFTSALVLGLYLLVKPPSLDTSTKDTELFDLSNTDIGWKAVGEEGFSEVARRPTNSHLEAVRFIRSGGPIIVDGKTYQSGARHAKRIILEFASLLDEVGSHWMADYAQLLYTIHDTMEE